MEVADAIAKAREKSESMARLARILSRIKPLLYATGTTLRLRDDDVDFYCKTLEDAMQVAQALPGELVLAYRGAATTLHGQIQIQGVNFNFSVPTTRKVRLKDCVIKRKRRHSIDWASAILLFHDLEIVRLDYRDRIATPKLKEMLWKLVVRQKKENRSGLEKFDFVL